MYAPTAPTTRTPARGSRHGRWPAMRSRTPGGPSATARRRRHRHSRVFLDQHPGPTQPRGLTGGLDSCPSSRTAPAIAALPARWAPRVVLGANAFVDLEAARATSRRAESGLGQQVVERRLGPG